MKAKNASFRILCFVPLLLTASVTYAQADSISQEIKQLLENVQTDTQAAAVQSPAPNEPARFMVGSDGYLRHIGTPPSQYFPVASVVAGNPEATARNFLQEHANLFGITSPVVDFTVFRSKSVRNRNCVRFQQTYAGLPVFAAEVIVQSNTLGGVEYVLSDIARDVKVLDNAVVSTVPRIAVAEAIARVKGLFTRKDPNVELGTTEPKLTIFDPAVLGTAGGIRLVWDMKVYSEERVYINEHILLDAHNGEVVRRYPLNIPARNRKVYDSDNTTADPGTLERSEGEGPSGIADVDDAYDFLGDTYDFYYNEHERDSIDDDDDGGMTISATVRYCYPGEPCPFRNAFWTTGGDRMYFGDAMAADDVVGHEYTHGVTYFESGLIYANHSGAINESFSDVWGEFIDLTNGAGTDTAAVRWELGEDCWWGTLRDMSDPPSCADPDRLGHHWFVPPVAHPNEDNDYGGVHTNCGVNNKLCYLLTDGDTFNGQVVLGRGIGGVADLYYEVQTNLLSSGADYFDLGNALQQAAVNLGWTSQQRNNVYKACLAVEIADVRKDVYVDWSYLGPEEGTELRPFNTVAEGLNAVNPGDDLIIKGGWYDEIVTLDIILEVKSWDGGTVTIGE